MVSPLPLLQELAQLDYHLLYFKISRTEKYIVAMCHLFPCGKKLSTWRERNTRYWMTMTEGKLLWTSWKDDNTSVLLSRASFCDSPKRWQHQKYQCCYQELKSGILRRSRIKKFSNLSQCSGWRGKIQGGRSAGFSAGRTVSEKNTDVYNAFVVDCTIDESE